MFALGALRFHTSLSFQLQNVLVAQVPCATQRCVGYKSPEELCCGYVLRVLCILLYPQQNFSRVFQSTRRWDSGDDPRQRQASPCVEARPTLQGFCVNECLRVYTILSWSLSRKTSDSLPELDELRG